MPEFNLLDKGWIPCLRTATSPPVYLSIREVFQQAPTMSAIADRTPTVTASIYRLLLSILHRSLDGPRNSDHWGAIWRNGTWDLASIEAYLNRWEDRFDLFSESHPFYQTPGISLGQFGVINQLTHDRASERNRPLLFDHSLPGQGISPDAAARYLIAQQMFSVGGLFSYVRGEPKEARRAKASPLLRSAVCIVRGKTLFETLMLNWYQYDQVADMPFPFHGEDLPAWERDDVVTPDERYPNGWVDLLTWQSRRILLQPTGQDGAIRVTGVLIMKGYSYPPTFEPESSETMVAYIKLRQPQPNIPPWVPVGLTVDRAVWRDSHALFQTVASERRRPRTLDWLHTLMDRGLLKTHLLFPLDVYGLMPDQAKVDDWRKETVPLPGEFIQTPQVVEPLRRGLDLASWLGDLLGPRTLNLPLQARPLRGPSPVRVLAEQLLRYASDRAPHGDTAAELARHLSPEARYWSALEEPFRTFVTQLPADFAIDDYGGLSERGHAARAWGDEVRRIARSCFDQTIRSLETSARTLRAAALAEERFSRCLRATKTEYESLLPGIPVAPGSPQNT